MRDFNDKDRGKKAPRIHLGENPSKPPTETLSKLESAVKGALRDGYLPCPAGWKIAGALGVPRIAVGAIADKLGVRITSCQIGFFRVDKNPYRGKEPRLPSPELTSALRELDLAHDLTCPAVFELAQRLKIAPIKVSNAANMLGLKIRACQLGCF